MPTEIPFQWRVLRLSKQIHVEMNNDFQNVIEFSSNRQISISPLLCQSCFLSVLFLLTNAFASAQIDVGSTAEVSCGCFELTGHSQFQTGAYWSIESINMDESFELEFEVFLGENDFGADGMSFVLIPSSSLSDSTLGVGVGGMGYGGLSNSLALQIDTYSNDSSDPGYDHLALMANGASNHSTSDNLAGPVVALIGDYNIEDSQWHLMKYNWDSENQVISVYMDNSLRLSYQGDVVTEIFNGNTSITWGFTASTGALFNTQRFCYPRGFPRISAEPLNYTNAWLTSTHICAGDSVLFSGSIEGFSDNVEELIWDFQNGQQFQGLTPGYVTFNEADLFEVSAMYTNSYGCSNTYQFSVNAHASPVIDPIEISEEYLIGIFEGINYGYYQYQVQNISVDNFLVDWQVTGGTVVGTDSISVAVIWDGFTSVRTVVANVIYGSPGNPFGGCTKQYMLNHSSTGITEVANDRIFIYPNPTNSRINFRLPSDIDFHRLDFYNLQGRKVKELMVNPNNTIETYDVSDLKPGTYLVTFVGSLGNTSVMFHKLTN